MATNDALNTNTVPITVARGGTGANNATTARTNLSAAGSGNNSDITNLNGVTGGISTANSLADKAASGQFVVLTAGENISFGNVCYLNSDSKVYKADNSNAAKFPGWLIAGADVSSTSTANFYYQGTANANSWSWTAGGLLYLSTSGAMTQTLPTGSASLQVIGTAINSTLIIFKVGGSVNFNQYAKNGANSDITSLSGITGNINLNGAPATSNASGLITTFNVAENVIFGNICYINSSGTLNIADATNTAKYPAQFMALGTATTGNPVSALAMGFATLSSWTWSAGIANPLYLSTSGAMTQTAPSGTDNAIQRLAIPLTATTVYFNPSTDYVTHV